MRTKTRKPAKSRARARRRHGRDHERAVDVRARPESGPEHLQSGSSTLRVNLTRIGSHSRFFITGADGETIVTSRLYSTPKAAKQGLIDLVMAIQADDFESFDHTT
jgi:uncharacterized protein YegP (UPF0339 family)